MIVNWSLMKQCFSIYIGVYSFNLIQNYLSLIIGFVFK